MEKPSKASPITQFTTCLSDNGEVSRGLRLQQVPFRSGMNSRWVVLLFCASQGCSAIYTIVKCPYAEKVRAWRAMRGSRSDPTTGRRSRWDPPVIAPVARRCPYLIIRQASPGMARCLTGLRIMPRLALVVGKGVSPGRPWSDGHRPDIVVRAPPTRECRPTSHCDLAVLLRAEVAPPVHKGLVDSPLIPRLGLSAATGTSRGRRSYSRPGAGTPLRPSASSATLTSPRRRPRPPPRIRPASIACAPDGIRTRTAAGLSRLPLPVGLRGPRSR